MGMAITTYKMKNLFDKQVATLITVGFTGKLKNLWDNYLTEDNRQKLVNATTIIPVIKTGPGGQTIENQILEDATASLIYKENENNSSCDENLSDDDPLNIAYSFNDSNNKETFFDMIDHIEDPDIKKKYLIDLRDFVLDKQSDNRTIKPFDMTSVLNKFKQPIKSETNLQSIQKELLQIRDEINDIRQTLNTLEIGKITNEILNDLPPNQEKEIYKSELGKTSKK
ncbi:hypothetical protein H5410_056818 [Solanum commersonii]|uniref:DUF7746 domain-containing protein n=1 Tax=Solanum commersonii TaxID=4109 RepID=A0A9J5WNC6_SOLCO|nr:hypothetical protein H5410_056818 [Solanum commersonii]